MGTPDYAGNRLGTPYNLTIWKWIDAYKSDKYYLISLQTFYNICPEKQYPAAFDTIGVYSCSREDSEKTKKTEFNRNVRNDMINTKITLPLDDSKMCELLHHVELW